MKIRFETCFRGVMGLLLVAMLWGLWAGAQTVTHQPESSAGATNHSSTLARGVTRLDDHFLTFGLDKIAILRETVIVGEPLWKYVASLIYILMAFYVAKLIDVVAFAWLKKLTARTVTKIDDLLVELLHGPI